MCTYSFSKSKCTSCINQFIFQFETDLSSRYCDNGTFLSFYKVVWTLKDNFAIIPESNVVCILFKDRFGSTADANVSTHIDKWILSVYCC